MIDTVRRGWQAVSWYVGSVMGDRDYARYLEHAARTHPDRPPLSEREYWRHRYAEQDRNPGARCC
ncbi:YbdD/YjiX family protein [Streptomyces sp. SID6673]|nr:YbdD/YjiX family protein [Streptomyces sp. SID11726]NEB25360.1 YbdD/YjiX family protein [Streptomyces sp. SID6673]